MIKDVIIYYFGSQKERIENQGLCLANPWSGEQWASETSMASSHHTRLPEGEKGPVWDAGSFHWGDAGFQGTAIHLLVNVRYYPETAVPLQSASPGMYQWQEG